MTDTSTLPRLGSAGPINRNRLSLALLIVGMAVALLISLHTTPPPAPSAPPRPLERAAGPVPKPVVQIAAAPPVLETQPPARRARRPRAVRPIRAAARPAVAKAPDPIGDLLDDAAAAGMTSRQAADEDAGTPR